MTQCWSAIGSEVMRVTRLNNCGAPVIGPCSTVISDGYVSIGWESEISEGTETEVRKANGRLCVSDKACDTIKWLNLTIAFCQVSPDLFEIATGMPLVLDHAGDSVGNRITQDAACDANFALETWSRIPGLPCGTPATKPWGYFLGPWIQGGMLTGWTLENEAASFEMTARALVGGAWGVGPYDVDPTAVPATPGPLLTPIGPKDLLDMHLTTVQPPQVDEEDCGCIALAA